jgi:dipeptidyl aminopeptidase/acylaminoacyl peptidase
MYRLLAILLFIFGVGTVQADSSATPPPVEAFAALPRIASLQLSPSGRHLAVLRNHNGQTYLDTRTVTGQETQRIVTADNRESAIRWFQWVNDERLLVCLRIAGISGTGEAGKTALMAVNRDGTQRNDLLLEETAAGSVPGKQYVPQAQDRIVSLIFGDPKHILVALDSERSLSPDVYKLDLYTGKRELVQSNPGLQPGPHTMLKWIADREGQIRAGAGQFETTVRVIVRPPDSSKWREFAEYDMAKETGLMPLAFDADPAWLYVRDQHRGRAAIFKIKVGGDPSIDRILVAADPKYDLAGELVYAAGKRKVIGVRYSAQDLRVLFWDFDAQRLQARIDRMIPARANVIHSSSADGRLHIVKSNGPAHPPQFFLFDERDGRMLLLGKTYLDLEGADLPVPKPITLTARDGKKLHGSLTVPRVRGSHRVPMILFPHGGPASHERDSFNYWTQWLVSRGWAVLEIPFRGLEGYGEEFLRTGFQRWGLEMQNDVTDTVQWAIQTDLADADKICLVGTGYGGYAALMGAVKNPDFYRCAVSVGGVTDLPQFVAESRRNVNEKQVVESRIGSWWSDPEQLRDMSPLYHASELRTPLLLMHGAMDRVAPVSHGRDMDQSLKAAKITTYRYIEMPLADHVLSREEDRRQVFVELEQFLRDHLE